MQFKPTFVTFVAATVIGASALPGGTRPQLDSDCQREDHPCKTYSFNQMCSTAYDTELRACVASGCRKFFVDPTKQCQDCHADNTMHICRNIDLAPKCHPQWVKRVDACQRSECSQLYDGPDSRTACTPTVECSDKENHPCYTYQNEKKCGTEWKVQLQMCLMRPCMKWIMNPMDQCKGQEEEEF